MDAVATENASDVIDSNLLEIVHSQLAENAHDEDDIALIASDVENVKLKVGE